MADGNRRRLLYGAANGSNSGIRPRRLARIFGSDANVARVEFFNVNGGGADFGDELHLFGAPLGTAVVCFATSGRIAVKGKLYADGSSGAVAKISFRRTNGQFTPVNRRTVYTEAMAKLGERRGGSSFTSGAISIGLAYGCLQLTLQAA